MRGLIIALTLTALAATAHAVPPSVLKAAKKMYGRRAKVGEPVNLTHNNQRTRLYTIKVAGHRQPEGLLQARNNRLSRVVVFKPWKLVSSNMWPQTVVSGGRTDARGLAVLIPKVRSTWAEVGNNLKKAGEGTTARYNVTVFKPRRKPSHPQEPAAFTVHNRHDTNLYWLNFIR